MTTISVREAEFVAVAHLTADGLRIDCQPIVLHAVEVVLDGDVRSRRVFLNYADAAAAYKELATTMNRAPHAIPFVGRLSQ